MHHRGIGLFLPQAKSSLDSCKGANPGGAIVQLKLGNLRPSLNECIDTMMTAADTGRFIIPDIVHRLRSAVHTVIYAQQGHLSTHVLLKTLN